tara:strand:- start:3144 stop:3818 length:675 start_codon:yes stop_codon:yes gene_type:complete
MVFKIINKLLLKVFLFVVISINAYANVIYDKNDIIISELDINYYKKLHYDKFKENINDSKALKNLVVIKKLIINLKKNNPEFLERIDRDINKEVGEENIKSQIILDILRYFKTRNEFIYNYFKIDFKRNDLENIFKSFVNLKLPISNNNCLTIIRLVDLKNNTEFVDVFFKNLRDQSDNYEILIDNMKYNVCINEKNRKLIDKEILKYADLKIEDQFNKFIYAQ